MKYDIKIEWETSKRGFHALRSDPCLGTRQVERLDEAIQEEVVTHFVDGDDIDAWDSAGHWGKAGFTRYHGVDIFNDEAVAAFTAAVKETVGPTIWEELHSFEVTARPDYEAWAEFLEETIAFSNISDEEDAAWEKLADADPKAQIEFLEPIYARQQQEAAAA
jgi:hypothetical protein